MENLSARASGQIEAVPITSNSKIRKAFSRKPRHILVTLLSVSLLLISQFTKAQAPQQFSFQGVARDATGKILANKSITVGFDIHQGSANGPVVFSETHNTTTNANGIFNLQIGSITNLGDIDWGMNFHFLKAIIHYDALPAFVDLGTTQLLSVPYSLLASKATKSITSDTALVSKKWIDNEPIVQTGNSGLGSPLPDVSNGNMLIWYPKNAAFRVGKNAGNKWNRANIGIGSFATGNGTLASGENSASFGKDTEATANGAFALGNGAKASGDYSFAAGNDANASGTTSTAIGENAVASSNGAFAVGLNSKAINVKSIAIGNSAESSGQDAVALGFNSKATAGNALAFGNGSEATGQDAVSFGNSIASGVRSFAVGEGALAKAVGGVTIGTYNNSGDFPGAQAAATDRLFQVGHGTSAARSNALTVLRNGNIGIGNNAINPEYILDIGGRARIKDNGGSNTAGIYFNNSQNTTEGFVGMLNDNEIGFFIGNGWRLIVNKNGTVSAASFQSWSDKRLKKDIKPIQNSLMNLREIKGYNYHWKDNRTNRNLQTGVVAQEIEKVFPELVSVGENGYKSVNYIGLIPHLIEAVKELDKRTDEITRLKKELAEVREINKRMTTLEAELKSLLTGNTSAIGKSHAK
ncbi:tail fiber domain-containing protein [Dyadobacter sp. 22481]|uniref:tail fiber domain-containing protein n=1 Tax=Dyadobacter sp. 22481 TaxID=3453926 RepID=UPI003F85FAFF